MPENTYPFSKIQTYSLPAFDLQDPEINIEDISHALAMVCRYGGHCKRFYSVAEHSVMVADILDYWGYNLDVVLEGLLHDASEAYLSDVPAPFKQFLPDWQKVDKNLDAAIRKHFGMREEKTPAVKLADWVALRLEYTEMFNVINVDIWGWPPDVPVLADDIEKNTMIKPMFYSPEVARSVFLHHFEDVVHEREVAKILQSMEQAHQDLSHLDTDCFTGGESQGS